VIVPEVSVALCTHNGERFIDEQLVSIFAQTVLPAEVVVSDDASTDATVARVRSAFAAHPGAPRLTLLQNAVALGVTRNFEQAIAACSGEIVVLSDQDDIWHANRVELTVAAFADPAVLLVHGDATLVDAAGERLADSLFESYAVDAPTRFELASARGFELLLHRNLVTGATAAIRREVAEGARPYPESWVHDEWLAVAAAARGRIAPLPESLIDYRQHGGNEIGAVRVNFRAKLSRLTAPGYVRNRRLLERAEALAERAGSLGVVEADRIAAVADKVQHERVRSGLSVHRALRIVPVLRELRTGRYGRYGGGLQDVARDLIQPLKPAR